jgi:ferritin
MTMEDLISDPKTTNEQRFLLMLQERVDHLTDVVRELSETCAPTYFLYPQLKNIALYLQDTTYKVRRSFLRIHAKDQQILDKIVNYLKQCGEIHEFIHFTSPTKKLFCKVLERDIETIIPVDHLRSYNKGFQQYIGDIFEDTDPHTLQFLVEFKKQTYVAKFAAKLYDLFGHGLHHNVHDEKPILVMPLFAPELVSYMEYKIMAAIRNVPLKKCYLDKMPCWYKSPQSRQERFGSYESAWVSFSDFMDKYYKFQDSLTQREIIEIIAVEVLLPFSSEDRI